MKKRDVVLTIHGTQRIDGEQPQEMELTTDGTMTAEADRYIVTYTESELTGLDGTVTTFEVWPNKVVLTRTGAVNSRMVFIPGTVDKSLYDMGFGALLMEVRARRIEAALNEDGGYFVIDYTIRLEQSYAGRMHYRIDVKNVQ